MSALLKSGTASLGERVRPFAPDAPLAEPPPPDPEILALREALDKAEEALAEQSRAIEGFPALLETAASEGEERGRASAEDDQAARLALLAQMAERALDRHEEAMGALDRLAALLAETCLEKMLIADEARVETVSALLRGQLAGIEASALVRILVSAEDFADQEALAALAPAPCEMLASPSLGGGDCSIELRLGTLEVGVGQQWGALRAALREMAE
jgi:flagellar biosynthesis/type III secretory pathway protein FliH